MKEIVKEELEKLFNVTIYNRNFLDLKPLYHMQASNKKSLKENLHDKIYENIYKFINYSKVGIKKKLMTRANFNDVDLMRYFDKNGKLSNSVYVKSVLKNLGLKERTVNAKKADKYDTETKHEDIFLLVSASSILSDFDKEEDNIYFLRDEAVRDIDKDKTSENLYYIDMNFESLLGLDVLFSKRDANKWKKSIEKEELPDMNIIYKEIPYALFVIAKFLLPKEHFKVLSRIPSRNSKLFLIYRERYAINEGLKDLIKLSETLEIKEILRNIDDEKIENLNRTKLFKSLKNRIFMTDKNEPNVLDMADIVLKIEEDTRNLDSINENEMINFETAVKRYIKNIVEPGVEKTLFRLLGKKEFNFINKKIEELIDKEIGIIYDILKCDKNETLFRGVLEYEFEKEISDVIFNLDDVEYDLINMVDQAENIAERDFNEITNPDIFRDIIYDLNKEKRYFDFTNTDFSKLKESFLGLINLMIEEDYKLSIRPKAKNILFLAYLTGYGNQVDQEYLDRIKNLFYVKLKENSEKIVNKTIFKDYFKMEVGNMIFDMEFSSTISKGRIFKLENVIFKNNKDVRFEELLFIALSSKNDFSYKEGDLRVIKNGYSDFNSLILKVLKSYENVFKQLDFDSIEFFFTLFFKYCELAVNKNLIYHILNYEILFLNESGNYEVSKIREFIRMNLNEFSERFIKEYKKFEMKYFISRTFK